MTADWQGTDGDINQFSARGMDLSDKPRSRAALPRVAGGHAYARHCPECGHHRAGSAAHCCRPESSRLCALHPRRTPKCLFTRTQQNVAASAGARLQHWRTAGFVADRHGGAFMTKNTSGFGMVSAACALCFRAASPGAQGGASPSPGRQAWRQGCGWHEATSCSNKRHHVKESGTFQQRVDSHPIV